MSNELKQYFARLPCLVLGRRLDEGIIIDGRIRISVHSIGSGSTRVRVVIQAPEDVEVLREELYYEKP